MSLPTTSPPPSSAWLNATPKSWRLIVVLASAPARMLPIGSLTGGVTSETSSTISFVTPWSVKSPVTLYFVSLTFSIFFDRERDRRELGGVEEGVAAQVRVALLVGGVDRAGLDRRGDLRRGRVRRGHLRRLPLNFANLPRTLRPHVTRREGDRRVRGVDRPDVRTGGGGRDGEHGERHQ